jgi:predicted nicotinamide N-methyase
MCRRLRTCLSSFELDCVLLDRCCWISCRRVLEIGAGMTGLCAVAVALSTSLQDVGSDDRPAEIIVTDGNPECVANQHVCWEMNLQMQRDAVASHGSAASHAPLNVPPVDFRVLRWMRDDPHREIRSILNRKSIVPVAGTTVFTSTNEFTTSEHVDVIIGADCLFFKEFHSDLLYTLYALLGCNTAGSKNRVVYLVQPRRGGTMELFLETLHALPVYHNAFNVSVVEDFDDQVGNIIKLNCSWCCVVNTV